jgi:hypothetical protein
MNCLAHETSPYRLQHAVLTASLGWASVLSPETSEQTLG